MRVFVGVVSVLAVGLAGCATPEPEPEIATISGVPAACAEALAKAPTHTSESVAVRIAEAGVQKDALGLTKEQARAMLTGAQAVQRPVPDYPNCALMRGIQGECQIVFDVSANGKPTNIVPVCTNFVFERAAMRSVERAEFVPPIVNGEPTEITGVIYPMYFKLAD